MGTFDIQLRGLPSAKDHLDRAAVTQWWDDLEDRPEVMGTNSTFQEAFSKLKRHANFPAPGQYGWGAYDAADNVVGFLAGQVDSDDPTRMGFVYLVDHNLQGAGFGTAILRKLIRDEKVRPHRDLLLHCLSQQPENP